MPPTVFHFILITSRSTIPFAAQLAVLRSKRCRKFFVIPRLEPILLARKKSIIPRHMGIKGRTLPIHFYAGRIPSSRFGVGAN